MGFGPMATAVPPLHWMMMRSSELRKPTHPICVGVTVRGDQMSTSAVGMAPEYRK
jgi:hypothetical protein